MRDAAGARPTEAGRRLAERARTLLVYVDEIGDEVRSVGSELAGTITLGLAPSLVPALAEHITARMAADHPRLKVDLVEALPMFLNEWLDLGRLDVGIFTPWQPYELAHRLRLVEVGLDEMLLVGAYESDGRSGPVRTSELASFRLVLTKGFAGQLRTRDDLALALRDVDLEIDSTHMIRDMVVRGDYWSVLPYSFVRDDLASGLVRAFELEPAFHRQVVAASRPGRQNPACELIVDIVRARLSDLVDQRAGTREAAAGDSRQGPLPQ